MANVLAVSTKRSSSWVQQFSEHIRSNFCSLHVFIQVYILNGLIYLVFVEGCLLRKKLIKKLKREKDICVVLILYTLLEN